MKKIIIFLMIMIAFFGITVFSVYKWYENQVDLPAGDSSNIIDIEIEQGESIKEIAVKLQAAGLIKNSDVFYWYIKFEKIAPNIQAGKFQIPQNLTIVEVAAFLQKASGNDVWVTIPEGKRIDEVAEILDERFLKEENSMFNKNEFLKIVENPDDYQFKAEVLMFKPAGKSLEGFLFPDTYNVEKDITSKELVDLFIDTLEKKLETENVALDSHKTLSVYEVITLASIIEREARSSDERYMISDILQRRLAGDMDGVKLLQTDATLLYELKDWEVVITDEIKKNDTEYNTYTRTGLIPTPICNSGLDSIESVMNPTANEYFFYLHDDEGDIHYAKTLAAHINNQRCYINKNTDYCL
ncbi:MAG: endolytic transglycosylase MltG [Patescibacteria group bacterium]